MTPTWQAIIEDPTASDWLKAALLSALDRDPVDAAADAEILAAALREHRDLVLHLASPDGLDGADS